VRLITHGLESAMLPEDLPPDLPSFVAHFGSDEQCHDYLFRQRWPDGFACRACGHQQAWRLRRRRHLYECAVCGQQHSLLTGTVFEQTKTGLARWFLAIYLVSSSKKRRGRRLGRLRLAAVGDASRASLEGFLAAHLARPAAVTTDGWAGYGGLASQGWHHEAIKLSATWGEAALRLPAIHLVFSLRRTSAASPSSTTRWPGTAARRGT
jgi:hypothetical protein